MSIVYADSGVRAKMRLHGSSNKQSCVGQIVGRKEGEPPNPVAMA
jgi:hypothetical protein